jgi:hypothetical protein
MLLPPWIRNGFVLAPTDERGVFRVGEVTAAAGLSIPLVAVSADGQAGRAVKVNGACSAAPQSLSMLHRSETGMRDFVFRPCANQGCARRAVSSVRAAVPLQRELNAA